jgi:EmrB/QacA subfamily drug resistance transporter
MTNTLELAPEGEHGLQPPVARGSNTNRWLVLVLVCLAQFMVVLDATIVNVALPSIKTALDFSDGNLQWVINSYTLMFGGFLLLGGRAADLFGRKRLFLLGVGIFTAASLLNGLATSETSLILFRGLQGLGAALVSPAALSIITTTFAEGAERTKALAVWGAIAAGGSAFGLLLGGILTDAFSWEWIFFVNVPIGVAAMLLSLRFVPESRAGGIRGGFDLLGAVLSTSGLVLLVYAIVKAQDFGWGSGNTLGLIGAALVLLAAFVAWEQRTAHPLIRLGIFRTRTLATANGVMLLAMGGLFAMFFFATLYLQQILGYSPLKTGVAFLPVTAGIILGSGLSQVFIRRVGIRPVVLGGMVLAAIGLALFTRISAGGSYAGETLPALLLISFGMGSVFVPLTLLATSGIDGQDAGLASGLFNTSQQVGGALGLAILSTLATNHTTGQLAGLGHSPGALEAATATVDGWHLAFWAGAALLSVGAIMLAVLIRKRDGEGVDPALAMAAGA